MDEHPGPWIAQQRKRRGLSQRQLADRAGVSPTTLGKIERQELTPHEHTLGKIYGVIGWPDEPTSVAAASGRWDELTAEEKARVLGYIDAVLAEREGDTSSSE